METVADVLAGAREREGVAFDAPGRATGVSFRKFATGAWKAGNLLCHYGVRDGAHVAVVVGPKEPGPDAEPGRIADASDGLLAILGATLLGAVVDLDPEGSVDAEALVAPETWLDRSETGPGCTQLAYGGRPDDASVVHFERQRWSENPVAPPEDVAAATVAVDDGREYTHADLVDAAGVVVSNHSLAVGDRVAVRARLDADVLAAGVIAPLVAGATIVGGPDADGTFVVEEGGDVTPGSLTD